MLQTSLLTEEDKVICMIFHVVCSYNINFVKIMCLGEFGHLLFKDHELKIPVPCILCNLTIVMACQFEGKVKYLTSIPLLSFRPSTDTLNSNE